MGLGLPPADQPGEEEAHLSEGERKQWPAAIEEGLKVSGSSRDEERVESHRMPAACGFYEKAEQLKKEAEEEEAAARNLEGAQQGKSQPSLLSFSRPLGDCLPAPPPCWLPTAERGKEREAGAVGC